MPSNFRHAGFAFGACAVLGALYAAPAQAKLTCTAPSIQSAAPKDTTITLAEPTAAPVPHCKVEGYVTTTNPGPNQVNFRLQLPDKDWNGRYYFAGLGGSAGYVPTDSQIPGGNPIVKGWVMAGTDTGRQGNMLDWDFLFDPAKALDHSHRGAHVVAVATQQITKAYYGVTKMYRYHSGCSGGGRMGMMTITRHPGDFDGVLIGAPGGRSSGSILKFVHLAQQAMREPGAWVSPAKFAMLDKKITEACDMTDGAKDGVVWDHRLCKFDVATLKCPAVDGPDCLTAPELKTIQAILAGPHGPDGKLVAEPMPITNISTWSGFFGAAPPPWPDKPATREEMAKSSGAWTIATSVARGYFGPGYDVKTFDFNNQKDLDRWFARAKQVDWGYPYESDLRAVQKAGEKVLFWNGRSDPCCSDVELEQYYREAVKTSGAEAAAKFLALYQVPGMGHCGGGTGPEDAVDQLLTELTNWVEKGQSPGPVITHRGAERVQLLFRDPKAGQVSGVPIPPPVGEPRDFLLCRFPQYAKFNAAMAGKPGAVDDAANWSCYTPKPGEPRQG
jgi:feruloyl esterase